MRVFSGRSSVGVRGLKLAKDDLVISLAILNGFDFVVDERDEYLKISSALRKNEKFEKTILNEEKINSLKSNEEFILSVTEKGFGKEVRLMNIEKQAEAV